MANSNQGNNGNQGNQGNQGGGKGGGNKQSDEGSGGRGFASMDPEKQREIAAEGGRAAHAAGTAHEFTSEEARRAGSMSHKNDGSQQSGAGGSRSGGRNQDNEDDADEGNSGNSGNSGARGTRGGTPEQHAEAGRQSHKNDRK